MRQLDIKVTLEGQEQAKAGLAGVDSAIDKVERTGGRLNASHEKLAATTKRLGDESFAAGVGVTSIFSGVVAADLAVKAAGLVANFAGELMRTSDEILKVHERTRFSIASVQELGYIGNQTSVSMNELTTAISQLQNRIGEGNSNTVGALGRLGLNLDAIRAMKPEDQFYTIGKAIAGVEDPTLRMELAMDLFGRSGAAILPAIVADMERLRAEAPKLSDELVTSADVVGDALKRLQANLKVAAANSILWIEKWGESFDSELGSGILKAEELAAKVDAVRYANRTRTEQGPGHGAPDALHRARAGRGRYAGRGRAPHGGIRPPGRGGPARARGRGEAPPRRTHPLAPGRLRPRAPVRRDVGRGAENGPGHFW